MIELSPLDVRKKKDDFRRSVRGYDADQVSSFLEMAADRLEELVSERRVLKERVAALEQQLTSYREREQALKDALLTAQELREEARSQAEREAGVRRREAEAEAREVVREAREEAEGVRRDLERLVRLRERFLHSLRETVDRFDAELETEARRSVPEEGRGGPPRDSGKEASEREGGPVGPPVDDRGSPPREVPTAEAASLGEGTERSEKRPAGEPIGRSPEEGG